MKRIGNEKFEEHLNRKEGACVTQEAMEAKLFGMMIVRKLSEHEITEKERGIDIVADGLMS